MSRPDADSSLVRRGIAVALTPAALVYGGVATARRSLYEHGWLRVERLPVPVVSVGGVALGGEGKTPVTRTVVEAIVRQGPRVGVVASGYGGTRRGGPVAVPSERWWATSVRGIDLGDEPLLLASWLGERARVMRGHDKLAAARAAVALGAQVVVVDDGLQHRRLHRDLEIVVSDGEPPLLPVPAGRARELLGASADLRWYHGRDGRPPRPAWPAVRSVNTIAGLADLAGNRIGDATALRGRRVALVAGVARPHSFARLVQRAGARVVASRFVRDHRPLSPRDLERVARSRPDAVLCTEKDAARMAGLARWPRWRGCLWVLICETRILSGGRLLDSWLRRTVQGTI